MTQSTKVPKDISVEIVGLAEKLAKDSITIVENEIKIDDKAYVGGLPDGVTEEHIKLIQGYNSVFFPVYTTTPTTQSVLRIVMPCMSWCVSTACCALKATATATIKQATHQLFVLVVSLTCAANKIGQRPSTPRTKSNSNVSPRAAWS